MVLSDKEVDEFMNNFNSMKTEYAQCKDGDKTNTKLMTWMQKNHDNIMIVKFYGDREPLEEIEEYAKTHGLRFRGVTFIMDGDPHALMFK